MAEDLFGKVVSLFSGGDNDSDSDTKALLRQVTKDLAQNKFARFFRPRSEELDPSFAAYLYDIYKTLYPVQSFALDIGRINRLKQITVESFMDRETLDIIRKLRPEAIQERMKQTQPKEVSRQLKDELAALSAAFDSGRVNEMNRCYNLILTLMKLARFDFYTLLQRFDPHLPEGNVNYLPRFVPLKAEELLQELANFMSVISGLEPSEDWKNAMAVLKIVRDGRELIPLNHLNIMLINIRELRLSGIIEAIGQITSKDPVWQVKPVRASDEHLAETWIGEKSAEVQHVINEIVTEQWNAQAAALANAVFGTPDVTRLQNYNRETNELYLKAGLDGFYYAEALNYLAAFIQDFVDKELQELCDILLVRGQWIANAQSLEMSDGFHTIADNTPRIFALDETLGEKGTNGPRLKAALLRVDRDKTQARYINSITGGLDEEALDMINTAVQALVIVGKHLKNLLEDVPKNPHEVLINWKELGYFSKTPVNARIGEAYKKINYFVQLMLLLTHPGEV
jgi:hypothetical protein